MLFIRIKELEQETNQSAIEERKRREIIHNAQLHNQNLLRHVC